METGRLFVDLFLVLLFLHVVNSSIDESFEDDDEDLPAWSRCPFIRNKLKNGRVKIRSRGRIAKFLCDPGFELAGKRFATCVRGQWNNPIPVCVSRGCFRPPAVANARVSELYRGAVLMYECLPGYTMFGGTTVYCDGRQWSSEAPKCEVATTNPQLSCDFEDPVLCGWSHDPTHDFDWKRNQFATPSGHVGTGPTADHTFGPGKGGFYLYMEASSPRKENDTARLFSPVYPKDVSGGCFVFWHHMFGSTTGGLRVYVKPESHVFAELLPTWSKYGDQGNEWFRGNVRVPQLNENFQIVIEGVRGSSYIGDTAIDDVSLHTEDCGNSTDHITVSVPTSCRGRCREINESYPCGCDDSCVTTETCCEDFFGICTKSPENEGTDNPEEKSATTTAKTLPYSTDYIATSITSKPSTTDEMLTSSKDTSTVLSSISMFTEEYPITNTTTSSIVQQITTIPIITSTSSSTIIITSPQSSSVSTTTSVLPTIFPITSTTASTTSSSSMPSTTPRTPATTSTSPATFSSTGNTPIPSIQTSTSPKTTSIPPFTNSASTSIASTLSNTTIRMAITSPTTKSTVPSTAFSKPLTASTTPSTTTTTISTTSTTPSTTSTTPSTTFTSPSTISTSTALTSSMPSTTSTPRSTSATLSTSHLSTYKSTPFKNVVSSTKKASALSSTVSPSTTSSRNTLSGSTVRHDLSDVSTKSSTRYSTENPTTIAETRRTYNFRPRYRTTPAPFTRYYRITTKSTARSYFPRFTAGLPSTTSTSRPWFTSTFQAPSTKLATTETYSSTTNTTLKTTMKSPLPKEVPLASKSDDSQTTVAVVSVLLLALVCFVGLLFYFKRWRARRQSKLAEDSEMRFLYENEVSDYSDTAELDRINFNPPLI